MRRLLFQRQKQHTSTGKTALRVETHPQACILLEKTLSRLSPRPLVSSLILTNTQAPPRILTSRVLLTSLTRLTSREPERDGEMEHRFLHRGSVSILPAHAAVATS